MMLRYFELRLERHVVGELFLVKTKGAPKGWKSTNSSSALRPLSCYYCIFWWSQKSGETGHRWTHLLSAGVSLPSEPSYLFLFLVHFSWFTGVLGRTGPQFSPAVTSSIKKSLIGLYPSLFLSSQSLPTIAFLRHLFPEEAMCMKGSAFGGAQADNCPAEFLVRLMNELFQTKPDKWVIGEIVRSALRYCLMGHFFCFVFFKKQLYWDIAHTTYRSTI